MNVTFRRMMNIRGPGYYMLEDLSQHVDELLRFIKC